jgi:hypothetical protein
VTLFFQIFYLLVPKIEICLKHFWTKNSKSSHCEWKQLDKLLFAVEKEQHLIGFFKDKYLLLNIWSGVKYNFRMAKGRKFWRVEKVTKFSGELPPS